MVTQLLNVFHNAKVKRGERSLRGLTSFLFVFLCFFFLLKT